MFKSKNKYSSFEVKKIINIVKAKTSNLIIVIIRATSNVLNFSRGKIVSLVNFSRAKFDKRFHSINSLKKRRVVSSVKIGRRYYASNNERYSYYLSRTIAFIKAKHLISRFVVLSATVVIFFTVANVFVFAVKTEKDTLGLENTGSLYKEISKEEVKLSSHEELPEYTSFQSVRASVSKDSLTPTTKQFYSFLAKDNSLSGDGTISIEYEDYKIKHGDNLTMVAKKIGARIDTIVSVNKLSNANVLRPGQTLKVPNRDGLLYTMKKGESIEEVVSKYEVPLNRVLSFNKIENPDSIETGRDIFLPGARYTLEERIERFGQFFSLPLPISAIRRVSSRFGSRRDPFTGQRATHSGIDIPAPANTPVYAARGGVVTFAGYSGGYGKLVIVRHDKGFVSYYGHLNTINVSEGTRVGVGTKVGGVGSTGRSTGNHLHFEIRQAGKLVNPTEYVSFKVK